MRLGSNLLVIFASRTLGWVMWNALRPEGVNKERSMEQTKDKSAELKRGVIVFAALAVLTVIEYFLGVIEGGAAVIVLLWLIALLKAGLVLYFFMHLPRVFRADGGH
jgi:heme/copper-type cytochrome/quinol oxidase subunit 4